MKQYDRLNEDNILKLEKLLEKLSKNNNLFNDSKKKLNKIKVDSNKNVKKDSD